TVLDIDGVDVRVGPQREGHVQGVASVRAASRLIIERIVDTIDLLLDWLSYRGLHHFGVGARIGRRKRYLWWHNIWKLRGRNCCNGNDAAERDDYGNNERETRPIDEDARKHASVSLQPASGNDLAGAHLLYPFNNDQLSLFEAAGYHDVSALLDTGCYAPELDLLCLIDHEHISAGLIELHGGLRNDERRLRCTALYGNADDPASNQDIFRIGYLRPYGHSVGIGVDLDVEEVADPGVRIRFAIWQLDVNLNVRRLVLRLSNPALVFEHIALAYLKDDVDGVLFDDRCEPSGGGLHEVSFRESGKTDASINGCADFRVAEVDFSLVEPRLRLHHVGQGRRLVGSPLVECSL